MIGTGYQSDLERLALDQVTRGPVIKGALAADGREIVRRGVAHHGMVTPVLLLFLPVGGNKFHYFLVFFFLLFDLIFFWFFLFYMRLFKHVSESEKPHADPELSQLLHRIRPPDTCL